MQLGFEKHIDVGGHGWGPDSTLIHSSTMDKVASSCHTPDRLLKVIDGLRERPEGVYVLLNALGAYEYWGVNRNGDAFPEWSLKSMEPPKDVKVYLETKVQQVIPGFMTPTPNRYGTCTFETDAHVYVLHANKDPQKAIGEVVAAAYNEHMHRTEMIVFIYDARDPASVAALRDGRDVPFSMGARLPFDVCSICFNVARNRGQYCSHLLGELNQVYSDGRKVFAYNWFPRFFDISRVRVPADRSAWSLRKVAALAPDSGLEVIEPTLLVDPSTEFTKVASIIGGVKTSSMVKKTPAVESESLGSAPIDPQLLRFVRDQVVHDDCESDEIADPQLDEGLRREGLKRVLSALALGGVVLKPKELDRAKAISGEEVPGELDLHDVPRRLITIVRVHAPRRSLVDPKFSERRKVALASARNAASIEPVDYDADYRRYLDSLCGSMESIVKEATSAEVKVALNPGWAGESLFKVGARSTDGREWLPFMTAATRHRWNGSQSPMWNH